MKKIFSELLIHNLAEVENIIENESYTVESLENSPPGKKNGTGQKRVVAIKEINQDKLKILWSYEDYC